MLERNTTNMPVSTAWSGIDLEPAYRPGAHTCKRNFLYGASNPIGENEMPVSANREMYFDDYFPD